MNKTSVSEQKEIYLYSFLETFAKKWWHKSSIINHNILFRLLPTATSHHRLRDIRFERAQSNLKFIGTII